MTTVKDYLTAHPDPDAGALACIASLEAVRSVSPEIAGSIVQELADQRTNLKLIASENYSSLASQLAMGNLLTDKYSEGYPFHRFYAGCDNVDAVESLAAKTACEVFGAEHAYVQPHSGADANLIAYWAILSQRIEVPALEELQETNPSNSRGNSGTWYGRSSATSGCWGSTTTPEDTSPTATGTMSPPRCSTPIPTR